MVKLKPVSPQVQALLNSAMPVDVRGDLVTIECESSFHRDKLNDDKNRQVVEQLLSETLGAQCRVQCQVGTGKAAVRASAPEPPAGDMFQQSEAGDARQKLVNHPAVKELQKAGGQITRVTLNDTDQGEETRGKQG